jgi:hypothetical protein
VDGFHAFSHSRISLGDMISSPDVSIFAKMLWSACWQFV